MARPNKRPGKLPALMAAVQAAILQGHYLYSKHALDRQQEREITRPEVLQVLNGGYHEKAKDAYAEAFKAWNYAVRGKTLDGRELRIAVSFDDNGLLIVTAIDLNA
jgi:hypothetical protein